jgi:hypothetical protein
MLRRRGGNDDPLQDRLMVAPTAAIGAIPCPTEPKCIFCRYGIGFPKGNALRDHGSLNQ